MRNIAPHLLTWIERTGNRLPDPASLFFLATLAIMAISQLGEALDWRVTKTVLAADGTLQQAEVAAVGLLDSDGLWWIFSHLVDNFMSFPPLGLVLVAMLGIGIGERSGMVSAVLRAVVHRSPVTLLTPVVFFLGVMSSLALDAGYIVLPPLAAALFLAAGRSPLAGLATAFAGVSAGFSANLVVTAIDPLMAGFSQAGAQLLDQGYQVSATANWWFMIASTVVLTGAGWWVTARIVEPRLNGRSDAPPPTEAAAPLSVGDEARGLRWAAIALAVTLTVVVAMILVPGAPLHGAGNRFDRWVEAMVPLLLVLFAVPAIAFGFGAGTLRNDKDVARLMGDTMAGLGPYIVLAFFAAQFIAFFKHSNLGEMLAIVGGQALVNADLALWILIAVFILVAMTGNLFIGSASAKYAFLSPVFVPMFMQVGISPELTQAAYRVGDSVTNVITPLNPYMVIVLAFLQHYAPKAGVGTLVALMLPYALVFALIWPLLLLGWMALEIPLGPAGPLWYQPGQ